MCNSITRVPCAASAPPAQTSASFYRRMSGRFWCFLTKKKNNAFLLVLAVLVGAPVCVGIFTMMECYPRQNASGNVFIYWDC